MEYFSTSGAFAIHWAGVIITIVVGSYVNHSSMGILIYISLGFFNWSAFPIHWGGVIHYNSCGVLRQPFIHGNINLDFRF